MNCVTPCAKNKTLQPFSAPTKSAKDKMFDFFKDHYEDYIDPDIIRDVLQAQLYDGNLLVSEITGMNIYFFNFAAELCDKVLKDMKRGKDRYFVKLPKWNVCLSHSQLIARNL
jgi:hypothetical protein